MKETSSQIGSSIKIHREEEFRIGKRNIGIARASCTIRSATMDERGYILWLTNASNNPMQLHTTELTISKNTKVAEVIIRGITGEHKYDGPQGRKYTLRIFNRTDYTPTGRTAKDLTLHIEGDVREYFYRTLHEMQNDVIALSEKKEEEEGKKRLIEEERERARIEEEEKRKAAEQAKEEAERKRLEEEARQKEEERKRKEEEERQMSLAIEQMEREIDEAKERVATVRSFIRSEVSLRSQHILDPDQELAKRSHFYDGVPIVIEGGPGTGKTTTMIQRLKFLLDPDALDEYQSPLTDAQKNEIKERKNSSWIFFSPTPLLLRYLINNMNAEGLNAVEGENTVTIDDFRTEMLSAYHLYNMDTDGPFKNYKRSGEKGLIYAPQTAIADFERYCVQTLSKVLTEAGMMKTEAYSWHTDALGIKAYCKRAVKVKDIEALMNLFNSMQSNEQSKAREKEKELQIMVQRKAGELQTYILENADKHKEVEDLFRQWEQEKLKESETDGDDFEMDDNEENEENTIVIDFAPRLFSFLKSMVRQVALNRIDSKIKLSPRQRAVVKTVQDKTQSMDLMSLGELALFVKRYAFLCRGIESNIINQIPRLYKAYRKQLVKDGVSAAVDLALMKKLIEKDNNKHLHHDEQDLIIGFINNMAIDIRRRSKERYEQLTKKNKYIRAYEENKKPVIGVDEATDYTVMDYYMIYSFRNYDYSAVTLCGDIMQGLNSNGIMAWSEVKKMLPKLEVNELKISYRQIPTLVEMSQAIYRDELSEEPPYRSRMQKDEKEPRPLLCVSDDEDEKIEWIVERLREVYTAYDREMPSVGIFIPNGQSVENFVKRLHAEEDLDGIKVASGSETTTHRAVKVYELKAVKGMEFEVVFFYDIDKALQGDDREMLSRYLYVGISRATSHLAATITTEAGNKDIMNYFDLSAKNWQI